VTLARAPTSSGRGRAAARARRAAAPRTAAPATLTLHRALSAGQRARRQRIVEAALGLAAEGGYDAVMMKDVAARAGVALGTVYRYFASKDHLLAESLVAWGGALGARLRQAPPRGAAPGERVAEVFRRMARGVEAQPELGVALTRALLSSDPSAFANRAGLSAMMRDWIGLALGDAPVRDREGVVAVLEHVCFSCMISLVNGQRTPREVGEELERTARLLLGGA
jgi:AcrR family transcriptional regulator